MKLIILAGNYEQYQSYVKEHELDENDTVYLSSEQQIFGLNAGLVVRVGTWWTNPLNFHPELSKFLDIGEYDNGPKRNESFGD